MNYNPDANTDDDSCIFHVYGCTDPEAFNYDANANTDDGSCEEVVYGCTDQNALNYNSEANMDNGSCVDIVLGCTYDNALNYNPDANTDDGSCEFSGCTNPDAVNYDSNADIDDGSCVIYGCNISAWYICPESYNPDATVNDWSMCVFVWEGCDTSGISILSPDEYPTIQLTEITDDIVDAYYYLGPDRIGCMDQLATNYLLTAVLDDASCIYSSELNSSLQEEYSLYVYPHVNQKTITIECVSIDNVEDATLIIYNTLGETIYASNIVNNTKLDISVDYWKPGIYYAVVKMKNNNLKHKFVVK